MGNGPQAESQLNWLTLGDDNTWYFHHSIQHRRKCNSINVLHLHDRTISNQREIQETFQKYYTDLLGCKMKGRSTSGKNLICCATYAAVLKNTA